MCQKCRVGIPISFLSSSAGRRLLFIGEKRSASYEGIVVVVVYRCGCIVVVVSVIVVCMSKLVCDCERVRIRFIGLFVCQLKNKIKMKMELISQGNKQIRARSHTLTQD